MNLTYRNLLKGLKAMTPEQLDQTATIFVKDSDEFFPVCQAKAALAHETDVLDEGHFYLVI